ncbi:aspartate aminotransferase family protein [Dactylosporangium vinaceum]|uniref:Aspartate aminotransferase family protein n=1 Tax=Dactylosporangium vinaceum TaxID=53362 RepID=A0ABV5MG03_9ACTN|nr:aspartate aminotransferase family protein [Dactylosporangium vinaceum]UAB98925.1 aspartate aminotransferase family protein [Dactylosporangium vinaceum]
MTGQRSDAYRDDRAHVFHSWSAQRTLDPVVIEGGLGATFWDEAGTRYLDFSSQLVNLNLGHQHPRVVAAIQEQAAKLCTVAPTFGNAARSEAARLIAEAAPGDLQHVFFTNGGTEANEHAIRMARGTTGRHKILAAYRSYHGATTGSITLTGDPRRWANEPAMPGVVRFFGPYPYRSPFHAESPEQETERALQHLDEVFTMEGPQTIAAVILEPVVGTNGILVPPPGYLAGVRALCDRHGALLIADEVMSGFGRCGEWFAVDHWDVVPDLVTFAKGVNSGYVPLGGVILGPRVYETFADRPFPGGLTYSGHPLACAAAVATIEVMREERIPERVRDLGERVVRPRLEKLRDRHPSVGEIRGLGLFWAIELVRSQETREMLVPYNAAGPAAKPMADVIAACKARGVWPFTHFNRIHVVPPLIISEEDLLQGIDAIDDALEAADAHATA